MTFKDVVRKNFLGNVRQYLAFFLCNTFTIVIFFIYATLVFNDQLVNGENQEVFSYVLPVTIVGITIFAICFLFYANTSFVKSRNKELGVYLSLGMTKKQLKYLVQMENWIINGASLLIGMLIGALFSRIFQLAVVSILELHKVTYHLDYRSFLVTTVLFVAVFCMIHFLLACRMKRMDITMYLKEEKKVEVEKFRKRDAILGIAGVVGMVASVFVLRVIAKSDSLKQNGGVVLGYMVFEFASIYLVIGRGIRGILHGSKKTAFYMRHMVSISEILKRYRQNTRILFVLSVLSTITILFLASPISLLRLSEEIAEMEHNSVEYVETASENRIAREDLQGILKQAELLEKKEIPFVYLAQKQGGKGIENAVPVLSVEQYNKEMGANLQVEEGACVNIVIAWQPGNNGMENGSKVALYGEDETYEYTISLAAHEKFFAGKCFPNDSVLLVREEEFQRIKRREQQRGAIYHLMQYKDWKDTEGVVNGLKRVCTNKRLPVLSILGTYRDIKRGYETFLFVSIVVAILFFVSGGAVLYFRQMNELGTTRQLFEKLSKIGVTKKEKKRIIVQELVLVYFIPVIFGAFAGLSLIYYCTNLFGGDGVLGQFMRISVGVIALYIGSQLVFYLLTKGKYERELLE